MAQEVSIFHNSSFFSFQFPKQLDFDCVYKCIMVALPAIGVGVIVGVFTFSIFHLTWPLFLCVGAGVFKGAFIGIAIQQVLKYCESRKFPAHNFKVAEAQNTDHFLEEKNKVVLKRALEEVQNETWFQAWMNVKNYGNIDDAIAELWVFFKRGLCAGITFAIVKKIHQSPIYQSLELEKLSLKDILYFHAVLLIGSDLCEDNDLRKQHISTVLKILYLDKARKVEFLDTNDSGLFTKVIQENKPIIVEIAYKTSDVRHLFFADPSNFFFYDSISEYAGLYQFPDQHSFIKGLYNHICSYKDLKSFVFKKI